MIHTVSSLMLRLATMVLVLLAFGTLPAVAATQSESCRYESALHSWASVLEGFVDGRGRIDFESVRQQPDNLETYLDCVAAYGPLLSPQEFDSREKRLAYYLNAYNALAMRQVIDFGIPNALKGLTWLRFFRLSRIRVSGEHMSLYTLENEHIRTEGDPRIHFALNCMAASCPRLPRKPFRADTLDQDLDRLTREFFAEPRNLNVDHENQTIRVTEVLDFFPEDFLAVAPALTDYVNRYTDIDIPSDYHIEFIEYDWRVNAQ
jgi:hypothetical protein